MPGAQQIAAPSQTHASPQKKTGIAAIGAVLLAVLAKSKFALVLLFTKGKLLLMGLTKASTFFSMLLSFGVYWTVWGWKFAAGLVISIYIHEMGHVMALRKFGIHATAPMFIPGLGAFIRLKEYPPDARSDARTGLAGPIYGLGAATGAYLIYLATGFPIWAAIAKVGAWINLFNLIPIYPLDGGHGFRALVRWQRFAVTAIVWATWFSLAHLTDGRHADGMLVLVGLVAAFRSFRPTEVTEPDHRSLIEFAILILALGALAAIPVPGL
jgi:Zn-dependent protease